MVSMSEVDIIGWQVHGRFNSVASSRVDKVAFLRSKWGITRKLWSSENSSEGCTRVRQAAGHWLYWTTQRYRRNANRREK